MKRASVTLALLTLLLAGCRDSMSNTQKDTIMDGKPTTNWVHGDGGPLVYLQSGALSSWQGASDFDNSILNGGTVRTDYDVICELEDGVSLITHHKRDMIVMGDVEWASRIIQREDGVFLFQSMGHHGRPEEVIDKAILEPPASVVRYKQIDPTGRLMVGADTGVDPMYDYAELAIEPGDYTLTTFIRADAYIARLTLAEQVGASNGD